jgi:hypothetical protein
MIERTTDANAVNAIINHPSVREWVSSSGDGFLDVSPQIAEPSTLALRGEHGVVMAYKYDAGIYEAHIAVLPSGRGEWSRQFARNCAKVMFLQTDCIEVLARMPKPHFSVKRLAEEVGFRWQFDTPQTQLFRGRRVAMQIYALSLQDWARLDPDVEAVGEDFYRWLAAQMGVGRVVDPGLYRNTGVALSMIAGGMTSKGIVWFNRAAAVSRRSMINVVNAEPLQIRFDGGILTWNGAGLSYAPCH